MSDWKRVTREISLDQVPAEMKAEVQRHIELYNLGGLLSDALICVQCDAEKAKKGLFGSAETNRTVAILTTHWLLWVVSGSKTPVTATSALLNDVVIQDYAATPFAKMVPDSGIQVSGRFTDVAENSSAFIGLENNAAGQKFKELAIGAVQNARK
jgi:hypothetical protein